jgi:anaerobic selenocysteine-containing dehydrogenase
VPRRIELDEQKTGRQSVAVEDSTGCIHGSLGLHPPASPHLLSEAAIVAGIAKATLPAGRGPHWDAWVGNYALVRDAIAETYPDIFHDFNRRMWQPGGFHRPIGPRERKWKTKTGKANFITPEKLAEDPDVPHDTAGVLQLITIRSNDQFNTTVYGYNDRFRGIHGTRMVVLMNRAKIARLGFSDSRYRRGPVGNASLLRLARAIIWYLTIASGRLSSSLPSEGVRSPVGAGQSDRCPAGQ